MKSIIKTATVLLAIIVSTATFNTLSAQERSNNQKSSDKKELKQEKKQEKEKQKQEKKQEKQSKKR